MFCHIIYIYIHIYKRKGCDMLAAVSQMCPMSLIHVGHGHDNSNKVFVLPRLLVFCYTIVLLWLFLFVVVVSFFVSSQLEYEWEVPLIWTLLSLCFESFPLYYVLQLTKSKLNYQKKKCLIWKKSSQTQGNTFFVLFRKSGIRQDIVK